jgi:DnaK suppressor protein
MYMGTGFNDLSLEDIIMSPEKLRRIKKMLLHRLNDIQFKLGRTDFEETVVDDNPSDVMDKASREFDQYVELTMGGRDRFLIRELQRAIMRIDQGIFGICEVCEGRISERRLLARPTSRLCIKCMEKEENSENGGKKGFEQTMYRRVHNA